jgi:hypothetical protein
VATYEVKPIFHEGDVGHIPEPDYTSSSQFLNNTFAGATTLTAPWNMSTMTTVVTSSLQRQLSQQLAQMQHFEFSAPPVPTSPETEEEPMSVTNLFKTLEARLSKEEKATTAVLEPQPMKAEELLNVVPAKPNPEADLLKPYNAYIEKARELGMTNVVVEAEKRHEKVRTEEKNRAQMRTVLAILQKLEIPVYPAHKVTAFMNKLTADRQRKAQYGDRVRWSWVSTAKYAKPVPEPILNLMGTVTKEFKEAKIPAEFHITDYQVTRPDPFLSIRVGKDYLTIAHWDEPGFKLLG